MIDLGNRESKRERDREEDDNTRREYQMPPFKFPSLPPSLRCSPLLHAVKGEEESADRDRKSVSPISFCVQFLLEILGRSVILATFRRGGINRPNGKWPKEDALMYNDLIGNWPNG